MDITEEEFDALVRHTLRIELLSGMVLIYRLDAANKRSLLLKLRPLSQGTNTPQPLDFITFETSLNRHVIICTDEIARVIFCFDYEQETNDPNAYYDNFKVLEKDTNIVEEPTAEGRVQLHVVTQEFLPDAIIMHKGSASEDGYDSNPLLYYDVEKGVLGSLETELENDYIQLRKFINLVDMDGEENFISMKHVAVMEFHEDLLNESNPVVRNVTI